MCCYFHTKCIYAKLSTRIGVTHAFAQLPTNPLNKKNIVHKYCTYVFKNISLNQELQLSFITQPTDSLICHNDKKLSVTTLRPTRTQRLRCGKID
jgi:hypothetical protein